MTRSASLGMHDGPLLHEANDVLWEQIAARLAEGGVRDVPPKLDRQRSLDAIWSDPGLLLAQCCGYPLVTRYRGRLRYVATPRYAAPGCVGASYRSRIVVRTDDPATRLAELRMRRAAVNERHSNSGMNLFRAAIAPLADGAPFFADVLETGSHEASLRAVAGGDADVAAIDAVSFVHLARGEPELATRVRTIAWTDRSPGLPFVTSIATSYRTIALLRDILDEVSQGAESRPARDVLLLEGTERLPARAYDRLLGTERAAARARYPELA